jgi:hypothetical protein
MEGPLVERLRDAMVAVGERKRKRNRVFAPVKSREKLLIDCFTVQKVYQHQFRHPRVRLGLSHSSSSCSRRWRGNDDASCSEGQVAAGDGQYL